MWNVLSEQTKNTYEIYHMTCTFERKGNSRPISTLAHCYHFKENKVLWYILPVPTNNIWRLRPSLFWKLISWEKHCKREIYCSHKTRRENRCQHQDILTPTRTSSLLDSPPIFLFLAFVDTYLIDSTYFWHKPRLSSHRVDRNGGPDFSPRIFKARHTEALKTHALRR
jgi:hypothetical protein